MQIKKSILALHRWVGLITGALVFIISVTGAIYVFEKEIYNLLHRKLIFVESADPADRADRADRTEKAVPPMAPATVLLAAGQKALGADLPANWIEGYGPGRSVEVHGYVYDDSARGLGFWSQVKAWKVAYVHPYSGEVLGVVDRRFEFFNVVRHIHQNMGLRYQVGHWIVGVSVLIFLAMMVTGLILWWPRNRAALKQRVKVAWSAGRRRFRFDLHAVFGFYAWIPLLIIVVTGLGWSFGWWTSGIYFLLSGKTGDPWAEDRVVESSAPVSPKTSTVDPQAPLSGQAGPIGLSALDLAFADIMTRGRPGTSYYVSVPKGEKDVIEGTYMAPVRSGWATYSDIKYDRYTGRVLHQEAFADKDIRKKYRYSMYDIHVGRIYGWPTQVLAFLASLVCASLPVTGFLMWRSRRKRAGAGTTGAGAAAAAAGPRSHPLPERTIA